MSRRPSFQFYPGDWLNDTALRLCSVAARGLWIDMLCLMHQGNPYGFLKVGAKVILPANLAHLVGATTADVEGWLQELEDVGTFSRQRGVIFSRRMVRDEDLRQRRAAGGKLGGNPLLLASEEDNPKVGGKVNLPGGGKDNRETTPSSSSSSSSSSSKEKTPPTPRGGSRRSIVIDDALKEAGLTLGMMAQTKLQGPDPTAGATALAMCQGCGMCPACQGLTEKSAPFVVAIPPELTAAGMTPKMVVNRILSPAKKKKPETWQQELDRLAPLVAEFGGEIVLDVYQDATSSEWQGCTPQQVRERAQRLAGPRFRQPRRRMAEGGMSEAHSPGFDWPDPEGEGDGDG
jgi:hypothetical protein